MASEIKLTNILTVIKGETNLRWAPGQLVNDQAVEGFKHDVLTIADTPTSIGDVTDAVLVVVRNITDDDEITIEADGQVFAQCSPTLPAIFSPDPAVAYTATCLGSAGSARVEVIIVNA